MQFQKSNQTQNNTSIHFTMPFNNLLAGLLLLLLLRKTAAADALLPGLLVFRFPPLPNLVIVVGVRTAFW